MDIWSSPEYDGHEQVCLFQDPCTGLKCVVAIHSTALGPACGGTRFKAYVSDMSGVEDALRLSRAMSYKSALANMPVGGGKAVIIGDPAQLKSRDLLLAYGRFIDRIGPTFITGEDVGMSITDVETASEVCRYMVGTSANSGDPSGPTAQGVVHALRAVAEFRLGQNHFQGLRVAVQGLGAVGSRVARQLQAEGARLIVADVAPDRVAAAEAEFDASVMPTETIHSADVDLFVPCALGGVVTETTASEIRAVAVAGAANNQLASAQAGQILADRDIIFAPDFVVNSGGVISGLEAIDSITGRSSVRCQPLDQRLATIAIRMRDILTRSRECGERPEVVAEQMAREIIGRAGSQSSPAF